MLKTSAWLTAAFLASLLVVTGGSALTWFPPLSEIGSTPVGPWLLLFWLVGMMALLYHTLAVLYVMLRNAQYLWFVAGILLAPVVTLAYYCFYSPPNVPRNSD